MENATVAVRTRGGEDLGPMTLQTFADHSRTEIARRGRSILEPQGD
jgi:threonyl-tRNA synthetase